MNEFSFMSTRDLSDTQTTTKRKMTTTNGIEPQKKNDDEMRAAHKTPRNCYAQIVLSTVRTLLFASILQFCHLFIVVLPSC